MKKTIFTAISVLLISCLLSGCFFNMMRIPDIDSLGEAKTFEKGGITITLTDKFQEQQSEMGFDAYFVTDFCGVVVLKESFTLEEGLAEKSLEQYITDVIRNNGHTNVDPQCSDGLWFYERTSGSSYAQSYAFKGSDAFWIVQFLCHPSHAETLKDTFYLWAQSVEVE